MSETRETIAQAHATMRAAQSGSILDTAAIWKRQRFGLDVEEREGFHFLKLIDQSGRHMATFALTPEEAAQIKGASE